MKKTCFTFVLEYEKTFFSTRYIFDVSNYKKMQKKIDFSDWSK